MSMKVLVAEDDRFLANAYRIKFDKLGYEVKIESDGEATLNTLKSWTPDILVLDLLMPIVDGFTVLQKMKADEKLKSIPVLVASNLGQTEDVKRAIALGANDFVVKGNMSLDELTAKMVKLVNK